MGSNPTHDINLFLSGCVLVYSGHWVNRVPAFGGLVPVHRAGT